MYPEQNINILSIFDDDYRISSLTNNDTLPYSSIMNIPNELKSNLYSIITNNKHISIIQFEDNECWFKSYNYDERLIQRLLELHTSENMVYIKYINPLLSGYYMKYSVSCILRIIPRDIITTNLDWSCVLDNISRAIKHFRKYTIVTIYNLSNSHICLKEYLKSDLLLKGFIESSLEDIPLPDGIKLSKGIDYNDAIAKALGVINKPILPWCCISGGTFINYDNSNPFSKKFKGLYELCSSNTDIDIYIQGRTTSISSVTDKIQLSVYPDPLNHITNFDFPICRIILMVFPDGETKYYYHNSIHKNLILPSSIDKLNINSNNRIIKYLFKGMKPYTSYEQEINNMETLDQRNILVKIHTSMCNLSIVRFALGVHNYPLIKNIYTELFGSDYIAGICCNSEDIIKRLSCSPYPGYIKVSIDELSK